MAQLAATSVDDLFRTKKLAEIHDVLKQTQSEVEAKREELRELVGAHYRSVLESSDRIHAMFECSSKVSACTDRASELIAGVQSLAEKQSAAITPGESEAFDESIIERDYEVGQKIKALLEISEAMRSNLGAHRFVRAARAVLFEAVELKREINMLLDQAPGANQPKGFDFQALVHQQSASFRDLPQQVASACLEAFGSPALAPSSAAEAFAVRLLLDSTPPARVLRQLLERRRELTRSLLSGSPVDSEVSQSQRSTASAAARVASAVIAFEGTVVLSGSLLKAATAGGVGQASSVESCLAAAVEGAEVIGDPRSSDGFLEAGALEAIRRRAKALGPLLHGGDGSGYRALESELRAFGNVFVQDWSLNETQKGSSSKPKIRERLARLVTTSSESARTCKELAEIQTLCSEQVLAYRATLTGADRSDWASLWSTACAQLSPSGSKLVLDDTLGNFCSVIEEACEEIVRERIGELQLRLLGPDSEEDPIIEAELTAADTGDLKRKEELAEMREQSRLGVRRFDTQLGQVLEDVAHVAGGASSPAAQVALLSSLKTLLENACEAVKLPEEMAQSPQQQRRGNASDPQMAQLKASWPQLRRIVLTATGLNALLQAASDEGGGEMEQEAPRLRDTLRSALGSGHSALEQVGREILLTLQSHTEKTYGAWARIVCSVPQGMATPDPPGQLTEEEVALAYGWGTVQFDQAGKASAGSELLQGEKKESSTPAPAPGAIPGVDGASDAKALQVPVQASPFVFDRCAHAAQRAFEVCGNSEAPPKTLVCALKAALCTSFVEVVETQWGKGGTDLGSDACQKFGMSYLLQWVFDLRFLRIALSLPQGTAQCASYDSLCALTDKVEQAALFDPVDRLLYQEVLKSAVLTHVDSVKVILAPLFIHNPLYSYHFLKGGDGGKTATIETEGFIIQTTFQPPLHNVLPRFPLLPVAMSSTLRARGATEHLNAQLGSTQGYAQHTAPGTAAGGGAVSSLMQQVGGGLLGTAATAASATGKMGLGGLGLGSGLGGLGVGGLFGGAKATDKPSAV